MREGMKLVKGAGVQPKPKTKKKPLFQSTCHAYEEIGLAANNAQYEMTEKCDEYKLGALEGYHYEDFEKDLRATLLARIDDIPYTLPQPIEVSITRRESHDRKYIFFKIRIDSADLEGDLFAFLLIVGLPVPGQRRRGNE